MTTSKDAVLALRRIHLDDKIQGLRPHDFAVERCEVINDLSKRLENYVKLIPDLLVDAYNVSVRQRNIYPIPVIHMLLATRDARGLQYDRTQREERVRRSRGFKQLEALAKELETLFIVSVRPDGVAVVCDFVTETIGEVNLHFA